MPARSSISRLSISQFSAWWSAWGSSSRMVAMLGRPCAMRATVSGSNPRSMAHRFQTRVTAGVESMSTPSMSKRNARQLIFSTDVNHKCEMPNVCAMHPKTSMNKRKRNKIEANDQYDMQSRCFFSNAGLRIVCFVVCFLFLQYSLAQAQGRQDPGRSIGKISTQGNLIVMELDDGALGKANLFDLVGHTLRFIPDGQG